MISNFIKIAYRNIIKDKFYSLLNIIGLSIGIASCLLILLYIVDELSYDRFFTDHERIYRVATYGRFGEQEEINAAVSSAPMAEGFKSTIPEIEAITRLRTTDLIFKINEDLYKESEVLYADSSLFDVLDFSFILGNPEKALTDPYAIVLTEKTAIKYFSREMVSSGEILGQIFYSGEDTYSITGVLEDIPENSHLKFDMLISMSTYPDALNPIWLNMNYYTYLKLHEGIYPEILSKKLRELVINRVKPQVIQYMNVPEEYFEDSNVDNYFRFYLQPIKDIHLHSDLLAEIAPNSRIQYIWIFSSIALFIITIACINFMNLSTARSAKRSREVGIRKTMGSSRGMLSAQFLTESFTFILIATLIALGLTEAFRIPFNIISGKSLSFNIFSQPWIAILIIALIIVVTFLAGSYPAFYLTRFNPVDVLKGNLTTGRSKSMFRSILVIIQFSISIGLIVSTTLVYRQMTYIQNKRLGFNKENVIFLDNGWQTGDKSEVLKQELLNKAEVVNASYTTHLPSIPYWSSAIKAEGDLESDHRIYNCYADYEYLETLEIALLNGRFYSRDIPSDSSALIINESAAKLFGWIDTEEALGKVVETINTDSGDRTRYTIIGVVKDFHFESLRNTIEPLAIYLNNSGRFLAIRVNSQNMQSTISSIKNTWKATVPWAPFEYEFLDRNFGKLFEKENQLSNIFSVFTILAIFIACMGLLGLAAYTAEQRTKEIGIRKAMGASSYAIVTMLANEFSKLVIIAFFISIPIAWYFMKNWLSGFAYKTTMGIWPFLLAGLLALFVALITISYQSIRAAKSNPVDSLRNE